VHDSAIALIELGAIFFGLGILGRLAWKIGISPIPFYLLGGLAFGSGGLIPLTGVVDFTELASEIGVILLLLLLGLEYSAAELVTGLRRSWLAGLVDLVLNATPGAIVALLLGWGPLGALAMAGVTYISSSGIVAKVLGDLGRLGNRETPVVLSILVFEDLAMAVYLPILTAVLAGATLLGGLTATGISLVVVTLVLVLALRFGRYVSWTARVPRCSCCACSARPCWSRESRRSCRCRRRSARSCSASRSPGPPRRTPRECWSRCATCSRPCSSSCSD
jgi:CPA2 family monovalent cation:H+ antiporter-2